MLIDPALHALEEAVDLVGVECLVEASGSGEIPGMHENVADAEHADRIVDAVTPHAHLEFA